MSLNYGFIRNIIRQSRDLTELIPLNSLKNFIFIKYNVGKGIIT